MLSCWENTLHISEYINVVHHISVHLKIHIAVLSVAFIYDRTNNCEKCLNMYCITFRLLSVTLWYTLFITNDGCERQWVHCDDWYKASDYKFKSHFTQCCACCSCQRTTLYTAAGRVSATADACENIFLDYSKFTMQEMFYMRNCELCAQDCSR